MSDLENKLRRQLTEMTAERDALRDQLDGNIPAATFWLQTKVHRQRRALDRLDRRNLSLRFALRLLNTIREPVTAAEWTAAREAVGDKLLRERVDENVPAP